MQINFSSYYAVDEGLCLSASDLILGGLVS